ncbi:transposase [Erwinia sp. OAMSP11]|nr:transposase [Erwinia sp. OAMSP11]
MCSGFIVAATNTGETVLKNQTADELYYEARYLSCIASATVLPGQGASPPWRPREDIRWGAGLLADS